MNPQVFAFFVLSALAVVSGIAMITGKNPVSSAVMLILHFFALAGLYVTLNAQLLAVLQIAVYAGAIMVLFVFVIMLLNLGNEPLKESLTGRTAAMMAISTLMAVPILLAIFSQPTLYRDQAPNSAYIGTIESIGSSLFTEYIFPFEAISLLLLSAIVGAIVISRRDPKGSSQTKA